MSARLASRSPVRRTRLVATIGPASIGLVEELVREGLDVARVNLSHGSEADHRRSVETVRAAAAAVGRAVGLLVDLPGPKIRLAALPGDGVDLLAGESVRLTGAPGSGARRALPLAEAAVLANLVSGDRVLLADGAAELRVVSRSRSWVEAEVVRGGSVRSRQGVSVPAERMPSAALDDADAAILPHALELEPDFVGQSFVCRGADVVRLRGRLPAGVQIVAKIETRPALDAREAIIEAADAIMVARGDLGVELPFEEVPLAQKDLVRTALAAGRPSIVATQMLESMVGASRPTRAEASDVANAILDGADAIMLSAETAIGRYPVDALRAAASIAVATDVHEQRTRPPAGLPDFGADHDAHALALAAAAMSDDHPDIVAMACYTHSGRTPRRLASLRPDVPVLAFTPTLERARSLTLLRGVRPTVLEVRPDDPASVARAVLEAIRGGLAGWAPEPGEAVALVQTSVRGGPNALELLRL